MAKNIAPVETVAQLNEKLSFPTTLNLEARKVMPSPFFQKNLLEFDKLALKFHRRTLPGCLTLLKDANR